MSQTTLGELEEIVVMIVAILNGDAYSVGVIDEIKKRLDREVSLGAIQTVLKRLEKKGLLRSAFGHATNERGGKRKRLYEITAEGQEIIDLTRAQRNSLWQAMPRLSFNFW
ncbi:helix-turn-helix transcriptional regulator [Altibacter sp.]|uniref:PadR family transcriptional regulator n=1 Tax=Altibacter sp. TaxID=2024823 RepID=UPI000C8A68B7|nr:helix-turn-helix transcriptional regulator [Altibacter sp.]MAP54497.1 PadR family transcriptional regulator [Altibacter sp.]